MQKTNSFNSLKYATLFEKEIIFWWLWGWWLMNLFKDCSVESCTSNIDQSVLIRAFSQSLLFPESHHYIPEKSNLRCEIWPFKSLMRILHLRSLKAKLWWIDFLFCEEDGKEAQSERSGLLSSGSGSLKLKKRVINWSLPTLPHF